jgi:hypothetical protein
VVNRKPPFQPPVIERGEVRVSPANELHGLSLRCTTPAIGFVLPVKKASAAGFNTCNCGLYLRLFPPRAQRYHTAILSRLKVILRPHRLPALVEKRKMPQRAARTLAQFLDGLGAGGRVEQVSQKLPRL